MQKNMESKMLLPLLAAAATMGVLAGPAALAAESQAFELDIAQLVADTELPASLTLAQATETQEPVEEPAEEVTETELPISLDLSYYLYSDYIFRFVNYSEYAKEGREKPNHQMTVDLGVDLGDFGALGFGAFFEWYAAQKEINGEGQNLQEVDYVISWGYSLEPIMTDIEFGVAWYAFPNDKAINTFEYFVGLSHNDAWIWKGLFPDNEDGILNPSFLFVHDVDAIGGVWMEFGLSHPFEICENLTLTPGWMVAIDGGYYRDDTFRFAGDQWSLVAEYDLASLLQLPKSVGGLTVTGELYYNNPWGNFEDEGTARDEFWGGMSVNWSLGG